MKIRFDQFELDSEQKQVSGPDGPVTLRPQTYAVLCHLIEQAPAVVSRDELLDAVWGHQATSVSSVAQTIKELRQALGDSSSEPHLIATRRRLGYQFIADIQPVAQDPEAETTITSQPQASASDLSPAERWAGLWHWPAMAAALIALVAVAAWWGQAPSESTPSNRLPTLAVAAMVNATEDPELQWLEPALETYLGHALVELGGFRVLYVDPRSSNQAQQLNEADYLIEGSYFSAGVDGSRLMANLRQPGSNEILTSLETGHQSWDVASLSIDLASAIRDSLGFSAPADADSGAIRLRLPRVASTQRAYFAAIDALSALDSGRALEQIRTARQFEPDNPRIDHLEAIALELRGDVQSARSAAARAMAATTLWPRRDRLELEATAAALDFDYQRAAERLQALNQFFPDPASSRRMIEALIEAGRLDDADEALKALRHRLPKDPLLELQAASLAAARRNYSAQLEFSQRAGELAGQSGQARVVQQSLLAQARALASLGDPATAAEILESLSADPQALNDHDLAQALLELARIRFQQGRLEEALTSGQQALALFEVIPAPIGAAESMLILASTHDRAGRISEAVSTMNAGIERFHAIGDQRRMAHANVTFGSVLMRANQPDQAIERLDQAAAIFRSLGDRQGEAASLLNHATLLARAGRLIDAEPIFQRALEAFSDAGDLRGQAMALGNLAAIAGDRRDMTRSIALAEDALGIFELLDAQTDIARVSYNLALIHRRQGDLLNAESRIRQAGEAFASQGAVLMQARALTTLGAILVSMGRFEDLEVILDQIASLEIEDPAELAVMHLVQGERALVQNDPRSARHEFQRAHELMEQIGADNHMLVTRMHVARAELALGQAVSAEQAGRELAFAFGEIRMVNRQIDALLLLASALIEQQRTDEAAGILSQADQQLAESPDAEQTLRLALLRSAISEPTMAAQRLEWVIDTAGQQGFNLLRQQALDLQQIQLVQTNDA